MGKTLLREEEGPAVLVNETGTSPLVLICEHASNRLPKSLGSLGLNPEDLTRHIAWDIGAEAVARLISGRLDAPLILQRYSRLAYDCNRPPEAHDAMPGLSEVFTIPGNQNLSPAQKLARIEGIYRPFHAAVSRLLDQRAAAGQPTLLVSIHSFTPVYKGKRRTLELGILHDRQPGLAVRLMAGFADVDARLNEPYGPQDGVLHTLNLHGATRGLDHAMIEIRNDLISHAPGQKAWAEKIGAVLEQLAAPQTETRAARG